MTQKQIRRCHVAAIAVMVCAPCDGFSQQDPGLVFSASGVELDSSAKSGMVGLELAQADLGPVWCVEFWVRSTSIEMHARLGVADAGLYAGTASRSEAPLVQIGGEAGSMKRAGQAPRSIVLGQDEWHHVAVAIDWAGTKTARLVVDGELGCVTWAPKVLEAGQWPLACLSVSGQASNAQVELGSMQVFDRFVSTAEIARRYQQRLAESAPPKAVTTMALETAEDWASAESVHAEATSKSMDWVIGQWTEDLPTGGPHARTCHALVNLGDGRLLVFGGELRDTHGPGMVNGDDTWIYHLDDSRWERAAGGLVGLRGRELRKLWGTDEWGQRKDSAPLPRCHVGMAFDSVRGLGFLLGGWFNSKENNRLYGDVWLFDRKSMAWREQKNDVQVPSLSDVQPVYHEAFDWFSVQAPSANWSMPGGGGQVSFDGGAPLVDESLKLSAIGVSRQAMSWYDSDLKVIGRFGGVEPGWSVAAKGGRAWESHLRNEVMLFAPEHGAWILRPSLDLAPSPRVRGGVAYDSHLKHMVLFGGITGDVNSRMNDLWSYDLTNHKWTELRAANAPGPRGGYFSMAYDAPRNEFILPFGRQDKDRFLDEVWRLRLRPDVLGTAVWCFDSKGWPKRLTRTLTWSAGEFDSQTGAEVRSSSDGETWGDWRVVNNRTAFEVAGERYIEVRISLPPNSSLTSLGFE